MRYAISSQEEIWVKVCYKFFEQTDMTYWYAGVSQEQAFNQMMKLSKGTANPTDLKRRIKVLYESIGIKE
jgi:hypothetical protein